MAKIITDMKDSVEKYPVKILIVDDKKENLLSLQVVLADKGYELVEASSGKDALRILLKSQDFAIILMDVQMPVMDGFETAELIRESDKLKDVPIIFLTANMNTSDYIFKGYQSGAVDYMIKPLSSEILQAKVMVFADLYRKNRELRQKEQETNLLNAKIIKSNQELSAQYAAIEKFAAELQKKNAELDAFAHISSHDLQEPLRKIETFTNMILTREYDNLSADGKAKFDRILHAAKRMRDLINDLLAFSNTNETDRVFENTDLNHIIENVKTALEENLKEKNAVVVTDFHGTVSIIPFLFIQLAENLLNNALKFSQKDIPLQVEIKSRTGFGVEFQNDKLQPHQNYCHISFKDNGIGFEPEHGEKIFGVFQRLHSKDTYEGTGIGLAIVKRIVECHNGMIAAHGQPMQGATINIYIPQ